jgi:hypothetical protein
MAVFLSPIGNGQVFLTAAGLPAAGGLISTYLAGTTTPAATYTTSAGNVANPLQITLNAAGLAPNEIWFTSGTAYKLVVTDAASNQIGFYDNLSGINDVSSGGGNMLWLGNWNPGVPYAINSVIQQAGGIYICILGNTNQQPPNGTYWTQIGGSAQTGTVNYQAFTATANQTVFNLGFSYATGTNQLQIRRNGAWLITGADFTETSTTSFTLTKGALLNDSVIAITLGVGATGGTGPMGAAGSNGTNGIPTSWQGAWSGGTAYTIGQGVSYNPGAGTGDNAYICTQANTGQAPPTPPGTNSYWVLMAAGGTNGGGSGTVTHTAGALTANQLVIGNAGADEKVLGSLGTTTTVLHGNAGGAPSFGAVSLTADVSGTLPTGNGGTGSTTLTFPSGTVNIGYLEVPQNSQSAAYVTVLGDSGKSIDHPSTDATPRTFTIAANASVAYPVGTCISFSNMTSQVVTIAINSDTLNWSPTGGTGSRSLAQYGVATARKVATTVWLLTGTGLS